MTQDAGPFPYNHNSALDDEADENPGNWIALSRRVRNHPIVGCGQSVKPADSWRGAHSRFEAWFDLLCLAQYKPARVNSKGEVISLNVGQLVAGREFLANRWNWTPKTVRGFLDTLETEGMIERSTPQDLVAPRWPLGGPSIETGPAKGQQIAARKFNKTNVISVRNYCRYQRMSQAIERYIVERRIPEKGQHWASEGPAKGHTLTLKEVDISNDISTLSEPSRDLTQAQLVVSDPKAEASAKPKEPKAKPPRVYSERFAEFWAAYPDRTNNSKPNAAAEFEKLDEAAQAAAIASLPAFAVYCRANRDYRCVHAERYLRDRRFESYAEKAAATSQAAGANWWTDPAKVATITLEQWRGSIEKHANGIWPVLKLGPPPGTRECVVPKPLIAELRLTEKYDANGISRGGH